MNIITTQKVDCQDCHRCMRSCRVKAIGIDKGCARLIESKCVLCGRCVVECPQRAKQPENQTALVKRAIAEGRRVILSVAPSFVAVFGDYMPSELWDALHRLGFGAVEETAVGAEVVSQHYSALLRSAQQPVISACCPVAVNLVKKYYPELVDNLAPVLSPMLTHGKMLKQRFGEDAYVVFAGPCIAKIAEKDEPGSAVNAVITFEQLRQWLQEDVSLPAAPADEAVRSAPMQARYYPIAGGILKSFTRSEYTATDIIAVDGLEKCMEVFAGLVNREIAPKFVEVLACQGGCVDGPASGGSRCTPAKNLKVVEFARCSPVSAQQTPGELDIRRRHVADPVRESVPSERDIREVLRKTGKYANQDEKNCGACGFHTCREKAVAVCQGLTTIDTCVPYMRTKAESFANIIVDNSLNAIIVVNTRTEVQEFNPAAEVLFGLTKDMVQGKPLADLVDCDDVLSAAQQGVKIVNKRVELPINGLVVKQMIVPVAGHDLIIVVMTDITAQEKHARELVQMKLQTVEKATEIINKQMQVAQEIAGLLGETTAETKAALLEVIWLLKEKEDD